MAFRALVLVLATATAVARPENEYEVENPAFRDAANTGRAAALPAAAHLTTQLDASHFKQIGQGLIDTATYAVAGAQDAVDVHTPYLSEATKNSQERIKPRLQQVLDDPKGFLKAGMRKIGLMNPEAVTGPEAEAEKKGTSMLQVKSEDKKDSFGALVKALEEASPEQKQAFHKNLMAFAQWNQKAQDWTENLKNHRFRGATWKATGVEYNTPESFLEGAMQGAGLGTSPEV